MKIVIATPLYPPDIAESAFYVKELAKRLSKKHLITVVLYGHLPEKIPGVTFICVDKRLPLILRLLRFGFALFKELLRADILYIENGASVELPAGIVAFFTRKPLIVHVGDTVALEKTKGDTKLRRVGNFARAKARVIIEKKPARKPEVLPFEPMPEKEISEYEKSWNTHVKELENIFKNV